MKKIFVSVICIMLILGMMTGCSSDSKVQGLLNDAEAYIDDGKMEDAKTALDEIEEYVDGGKVNDEGLMNDYDEMKASYNRNLMSRLTSAICLAVLDPEIISNQNECTYINSIANQNMRITDLDPEYIVTATICSYMGVNSTEEIKNLIAGDEKDLWLNLDGYFSGNGTSTSGVALWVEGTNIRN